MKSLLPRSLLLAFVLCAPALAVEGPNPYLGQAKVFYQGLEFEKCLQRLSQAHRWSSTPEEAVEIELYGGLCSYNLGKEARALERFAAALQLDPQAQLPAMTSPKIVELFRTVASKVERSQKATASVEEPRERPEPKEPKEPRERPEPKEPQDAPRVERRREPPSGELPEPEPNRLTPHEGPDERPVVVIPVEGGPPSALVAPVVLGGVAVIGAGVGAFFGVQAKKYEQLANTAVFESDANSFGGAARRDATVANVSYGVAAAAAVTAIVAYFAFSPRGDP